MNLKYFTTEEIEKVSKGVDTIAPAVLYNLDKLRDKLQLPIVLTEINLKTHSKLSYHYWSPCQAVDFVVIGEFHPNQVIQYALDCDFRGIGWYPEWRPKGGFHCDVRPIYKLWTQVDGKYLPMVGK